MKKSITIDKSKCIHCGMCIRDCIVGCIRFDGEKFPAYIDNGDKIYGYKNLDYDKIIEIGMVAYTSDINSVARAGSNPLVVRALKVVDHNSNPVISVADSNRILIENDKTGFLDKLNVVFIR